MEDQVDLSQAFFSYSSFQNMMNDYLLPALRNAKSATVAVLALQSLYQIETVVDSRQFQTNDKIDKDISEFLRQWRCKSPLQTYDVRIKTVLKSLTIFETFKVPLFIDSYGNKRLMSEFESLQEFTYDGNTKIVHVTHEEEKDKIFNDKKFQPSDNKNAIKGVWFSPKDYPKYQGDNLRSKYGNYAFETTLGELGISRLTQGEIVSYKEEVNFILYPSKEAEPVKTATIKALRLKLKTDQAYAAVSIFVPWNILPDKLQESLDMLTESPYEISHGPFCVKERRSDGGWRCPVLSSKQVAPKTKT